MSERFDRIIVAGDWHRAMNADFPKRVVELAALEGITTILHLGDLGYLFGPRDEARFEMPLNAALKESDVTLYFVDGNHDNHALLQSLPLDSDGFKTLDNNGRVRYAPRGHRWTWGTRTFGAMGGAYSVNWPALREGETLFRDLEEPTLSDLAKLGRDPLDYLVAHDVPTTVTMGFDKNNPWVDKELITRTRDILQCATENTQPKRIFSGHWHQRKDYLFTHNNGAVSEGHVINREHNEDNIVLLNLTDNTITTPNDWHK